MVKRVSESAPPAEPCQRIRFYSGGRLIIEFADEEQAVLMVVINCL